MSGAPARPGTILICAIHRTHKWWRHVGDHLGYERTIIVTDSRGAGDLDVVDDFYAAFRQFHRDGAGESRLLDAAEIDDIVARCRVLRCLPRRQAAAMALAMAQAYDRVLDEVRPVAGVALPIDRYTTDVLVRLARKRGIPFYEMTASPLPRMAMLIYRGRLVRRQGPSEPALLEAKRAEVADPLFTPVYVQGQTPYTRAKFLKIFGYFQLRAWVFRGLYWALRNPLYLQALDARSDLRHKPGLRDIAITRLVDPDWRAKAQAVPRERRLFLGLQLFPEASIDYWIDDRRLLDYEALVLDVARAFSAAGYTILVKDHPLQFGFRQIELIERLCALPGVVIVPYEVGGSEVIGMCGTNFTCTGTLGLQAALLGVRSIVVPNYYSNPEDFIEFAEPAEAAGLPARIAATAPPGDLKARQTRIVDDLLRGSFDGDFFTLWGFRENDPPPAAAALGRAIGAQMHAMGPDGEDWHRRHGL